MSHHNAVFSQLLKLVPRHEFEVLVNQHHAGGKLRKMTRWSQFFSIAPAQLSRRVSLRDAVSNLSARTQKLYHLGIVAGSRFSLARIYERQPYAIYEALFSKLLSRCQGSAPRHGFRFKNIPYSPDASTVVQGRFRGPIFLRQLPDRLIVRRQPYSGPLFSLH